MSIEAAKFNWDAIPVKTGATADPAPGAQLAAITVPAGRRWLFCEISVTLTCDATVANRWVNLGIKTNGTHYGFYSPAGLTVTASQSKQQSFVAGSFIVTAGTQYGMHFPLTELPAGAVIELTVNALQAGDDMGAARYFYKEVPA